MVKDLTHALRMLSHSKGWTAVVVLSLALGIGANTALFTAINGVLLQTLPLPDPDALVRIKWAGDNDMVRSTSEYGSSTPHNGLNVTSTFSFPAYQALRAANQALTDLAAGAPMGSVNVVIDNEAEVAGLFGVSGNYFQVVRIPMAMGRTLGADDDAAGAAPVAVISHAFWRRRFASDPSIVGRVVSMNNQPVTVVGVTAAEFSGTQRLGGTAPEVTVALAHDPLFNVGQTRLQEPTSWWLQLIGRARSGVTHDQIRGNLEGVFQQSARAGMDAYYDGLTPAQRELSTNRRDGHAVPQLVVQSAARGVYDLDTGSAETARMLAVVVVLVLMIVCANVANLLLARASARRREVSVRVSLGATRGRLVRQLLTESLLLAALGGGAGLLLGYWSRELLPFGQTAPIDWRVIAFVSGVSLLTGVIFGLAPALRATRVDLAGVMKESGRSVVAGRNLLTKTLLVVQVAVSLVLVIGAGLFLRTLDNLRSIDVGFNPRHLVTFSVNPFLNRYEAPRIEQLYRDLHAAFAALPGVQAVALTRLPLLGGSSSSSTWYPDGGGDRQNVNMMSVSPEFFAAMEIPVVLGRAFTDRDRQGAPKVVIINETAARKFFPEGNALGRRVGGSPESRGDNEIVGIIRDTKYSNLRSAPPATLYQPAFQSPMRGMTFVLRTGGDPADMANTIRATVRRLDPALPVTNVATQVDLLDRRVARERLFATTYSIFGGLALVLAALGLFGVLSYSVSRRRNEIGVRMALGARRGDVARMMIGESLLLVGAGAGVGLVTAWLGAQRVAEHLYGLEPRDATTFVVAVAVIAVVSLAAAFLPTRRATRVDPMVALRQE